MIIDNITLGKLFLFSSAFDCFLLPLWANKVFMYAFKSYTTGK